uniref:RNA helicase n=1 Tax=Glossina pallidipes TaxID=7398 RepID=A0A1B0A769_GLOPL
MEKICQKVYSEQHLRDDSIAGLRRTYVTLAGPDNAKLSSGSHNEKYAENITNSDTIIHIKKKEMITLNGSETGIETLEPVMLAHSNVPINSLKTINEAQFLPQIHYSLLHVGINKIYRVQAYAWSHLLRNNSLFVVNPSKSGKTWSYLPALCNDTYYDVNDLDLTYGPVAIVLVASAKHVQIIADHCRRLLHGLTDEASVIVASFVSHELRGLNLVVLLVKGVCVNWPRLLKDSTKFNWLTYNYNAIDIGEIDGVEPTSLSSAVQIASDDVTDSDNDSEKDLFETYGQPVAMVQTLNARSFHILVVFVSSDVTSMKLTLNANPI